MKTQIIYSIIHNNDRIDRQNCCVGKGNYIRVNHVSLCVCVRVDESKEVKGKGEICIRLKQRDKTSESIITLYVVKGFPYI